MTELNENDIELVERRLFLDTSSSCTGYVVARIQKGATLDMSKATCVIERAGALWFPADWTNPQKYAYMYKLVTEDFYVISAITDIIYERYSFSPSQRMGSLVVPEMIGAIKAASQDVCSMPLGIEEIAPQTWRSQIGLKAVTTKVQVKDKKSGLLKEKTKRDFKQPCIDYFDRKFDIPEKLLSNVTGNERATPNDLYDALGICEGWHRKLGITKFELKDNALNVGVLKV